MRRFVVMVGAVWLLGAALVASAGVATPISVPGQVQPSSDNSKGGFGG